VLSSDAILARSRAAVCHLRAEAERIWQDSPKMKVNFSSGYGAETLGKDFKLEPEVNFLQKPYHPQALALAVRRCLDEK